MFEPRLVREQQAILARLQELIASRSQATVTAENELSAGRGAAEEQFTRSVNEIDATHAARTAASESAYAQRRSQAAQSFGAQYRTSEHAYLKGREQVDKEYDAIRSKAKQAFHEARWESTTVYDATKHKPKKEYAEAVRQVTARAERLGAIAEEAKQFLFDCRMYRAVDVVAEGSSEISDDPLKQFLALLAESETNLLELRAEPLPKLFRGGMFLWVFIAIALLLAYPVGWLTGWELGPWLASVGGITVIGAGAALFQAYRLARGKAHAKYQALGQKLVDAERAREAWQRMAEADCIRRTQEIRAKHECEIARATEAYEAVKNEAKRARSEGLAAVQQYPGQLAEMERARDAELAKIDAEHHAAIHQLREDRAAAVAEAEARRDAELMSVRQRYDERWTGIADQWRKGLAGVQTSAREISAEVERVFPAWNSPAWENWLPPREVSPVVPYGTFELRLGEIPGGMPKDERLKTDLPDRFSMPAMLSFPKQASLMVRAGGSGRAAAIETLQSVMLRFITGIPPGKLRFTIIDPVGLGQNFAGFMHLADYDEQLVSSQIFTEPRQIEQKLVDLTQHMSTVIQKYLRNEYETIEEYNEKAGEVAEPFRLLVVANFPFNFSETATRHLVSIASTGSRCGVYTLIGFDPKLQLPHGFRLPDLEEHAQKLAWREGGFALKEPAFEKLPLTVEKPPTDERFNKVIHLVGTGAKDANRVEVPFEFVAPEPSKWWTYDSRKGVEVAIGRAGATKRQMLSLGRGTAQHVLIAGKTGSGKSTLLHALITNLALCFKPDEVELYLIDFKKGVEFKTYAAFELPHARVVAIESEREFGLSVLQRLDVELKRRGDLFRDVDVADVNGYRNATNQPMPRILLIVDEFQEFFVEDDKIAQDASLLLDRLVRQGRAFGIHIHLGSQTLGGAYSLARSTLGQMAIRIALQCSEADANLILSEENTAARLLSRPGEAIYNDANGRSEGNNLFQVVWLSDDRHAEYLRRIHEMAEKEALPLPPQIVFEGNVPADVARNPLLQEKLAARLCPPAGAAPLMWLGEAIAIKDPTAVPFRRQSGASLLLIGQQSEPALAIMALGTVSLAAQLPPPTDTAASAKFYVLDGQTPEAPHAGLFARLGEVMPHPLVAGTARDTARIIGEVAAEVERRQAGEGADGPPIFLFIYDLARFRELRKQDDDFGFSREDKPSPSKQMASILREGPLNGVHVIAWCDTLANVQRTFDRQTAREFESRVLFQMSVADSSSLIDSPAASRLGVNRGLLHDEEQGLLEKFRPYSLPTTEWLVWVTERLRDPARRPGAVVSG